MRYAYTEVNITPNFPIKQFGFIQQTKLISDVHDPLYARICSFFFNDTYLFIISCDNIGLPYSLTSLLTTKCEKHFNRKCHVILSCTHTHFGADPLDIEYQNFLINRIYNTMINCSFSDDSQLQIRMNYELYDGVGTSRITGHKALVLLQTLMISKNNFPIFSFIQYNCHPTILNGDTPYFTSEYPGYTIKSLSKIYPATHFLFFTGAAGDISTRFTRQNQNYESVKILSSELVNTVDKLMNHSDSYQNFSDFKIFEKKLKIKHDLSPIKTLISDSKLTQREQETIDIGKKCREKLLLNHSMLIDEITITCVMLGKYKLIFAPNELFSYYIKATNSEDTMLICYSNGYEPYVTGLDFNKLTYETFTDTWTIETKQRLYDLFSYFSSL